jgi:hypothetical protein
MYYNRLTKTFICDLTDYFFLSFIIASIVSNYLKHYYWSEKASMQRSKDSIIDKSSVITPVRTINLASNLSYEELRFRKIYRFGLNVRGGVDYEYQFAEKIKDLVLQWSSFLKENEFLAFYLKKKRVRDRILQIICSEGQLILRLVLHLCKINLQYILISEPDQQFIVIASCAGGVAGFITSWLSAGTILFVTPTALSIFIVRSLVSQIAHNIEYGKVVKMAHIVLNHEIFAEFQEKFLDRSLKSQERENNSKAIELQGLNWNKNSDTKEMAKRLGVFENSASVAESLNLDTLDLNPSIKKIFEEFGFTPKTKNIIKAKMVNFRHLVDRAVDVDNNVIYAEIVQDLSRIRIKD